MTWIILLDLISPWVPLGCSVIVYGIALLRWMIATRLVKQVERMECLECGYPLRPSWPCPECGGRPWYWKL